MKKSTLILLLILIASCSPSQAETIHNFPFEKSWEKTFNEDIYAITMANCQVAVAGPSKLTIVDANNGNYKWSTRLFYNPESVLSYADGMLIAASSDTINIYNESGQEIAVINIDNGGGNAHVISAFSHYIFVIRTPGWVLEVYDSNTSKLAWEMAIERGGMDINYENVAGYVYITALDGIKAVNITNGYVIWSMPAKASISTYENGLIYYLENAETEDLKYISAINVDNRQELWRAELDSKLDWKIYSLTIFDNVLVATTQYGLLGFDKEDGHELWQSESRDQFYSSPTTIDNLYAKGSMSNIIYSISLNDGHNIGYLQLENSSSLVLPYYESRLGIYSCGNTLVFSNYKTVVGYKKIE